MGDNIQRLFETVEDLRRKANVNAAFGRPVTAEGRTVIPVAEVAYGFGLGFGSGGGEEPAEEEAEGGGGGGGVRARPLGVVEITPEGVRVEPVVDEQRIALAGVLLTAWIVFWIARTLAHIFGREAKA
ncbi:MAG TPA: hypothetical protein EYH30_08320 [Anaerolineales bacterium]|nr:hypothetical protein [Anaerolineae bacterium]HIQ02117.1 hypothetical protein [Anaerolineales bacterium]